MTIFSGEKIGGLVRVRRYCLEMCERKRIKLESEAYVNSVYRCGVWCVLCGVLWYKGVCGRMMYII